MSTTQPSSFDAGYIEALFAKMQEAQQTYAETGNPLQIPALLVLSIAYQGRTGDDRFVTYATQIAEQHFQTTGDGLYLTLASQLVQLLAAAAANAGRLEPEEPTHAGTQDSSPGATVPMMSIEPTAPLQSVPSEISAAQSQYDPPLQTDADHDGADPIEDTQVEPPPAPTTDTISLGRVVLDFAESFLSLREDAGTNNDHAGLIRRFFVEGVKWPTSTWDSWAQKFPNSGVPKPEWCAAFASFCMRRAYERFGKELPVKLAASSSDTEATYEKAHRFVRRGDLFDENGRVKPGARRPGPGDMVVWRNHVGLLKELREDGSFITVEGNTWQGTVRKDGVYQLTRKSLEKTGSGEWKLHGFCLGASLDGSQTTATS